MIEPRNETDIRDCFGYGVAALTVWREAQGESYEGKVAVAEVIVNRAEDPRWPDELDEVVLQKMQFSCYNPGDPVASRMPDLKSAEGEAVFQDCCRAVAEALTGRRLTGGANHYLNVRAVEKETGGKLPSWYDKTKVTAIIGNHEFLKL